MNPDINQDILRDIVKLASESSRMIESLHEAQTLICSQIDALNERMDLLEGITRPKPYEIKTYLDTVSPNTHFQD